MSSRSTFPMPKLLRYALLASTLVWCGVMPRNAIADLQFTTNPGSDSDGAVAATVNFYAINGGIEIVVQNIETAEIAKGQAISAVQFSVAGGLSLPTKFYELSGSSVDSAKFSGGKFPGSAPVTPFNATGSNVIDHWGLTKPASSTVYLATAGNGAPGGNPLYMILPSSGTYNDAGKSKSLADGHFDPYILGSATFFLTVPGVTTSTVLTTTKIPNVQVYFGTGPDTPKGITTIGHDPSIQSVPEPSSLTIVLVSCGLGLVGVRARRRSSTRTS
jgi:hypothetical protein